LKVNLAKSNLIHVENVNQVGRLARILGCGVATLLVKYLGLPLEASYKSTHIWDGVIEKIALIGQLEKVIPLQGW
jgi:hypothetical protein